MKELPGAEEEALAAADVVAIKNLVARLTGQLKPGKIGENLATMREALDQTPLRPTSTLGHYLGAEAAKPAGQGRCDSAWRWDTALWLTVEAKSEQVADGLLPLKDIRQANTQLDQLAADQGIEHAPAGSPTIIVSDRLTVAPEHAAVANPNVYLASTDVVRQIAGDVEAVWTDLLASAAKQQPAHVLRRHVHEVLSENGCLPTQVVDRLTQDRVRPGEV